MLQWLHFFTAEQVLFKDNALGIFIRGALGVFEDVGPFFGGRGRSGP
jgi:hypothetical protein